MLITSMVEFWLKGLVEVQNAISNGNPFFLDYTNFIKINWTNSYLNAKQQLINWILLISLLKYGWLNLNHMHNFS